MTVTIKGLDHCLKRLQAMQKSMDDRLHELIEKLAEMGIEVERAEFAKVAYDGEKDVSVGDVVWLNEKTAQIIASGRTVLFLEFGSGTIGEGHERAAELGYGPGTWSDNEALGGKGHWKDEGGWYYAHGKKSVGNRPARAVYQGGKTMRNSVASVAKEVFGHD